MAKVVTTLLIVLLICSTVSLIHAARPNPAFHHQGEEAEQVEVDDNVDCEGLSEEDCLIRRSLVAHTDYIYTQQHKP